MRYIKLYENFNSKVQYFVKKTNNRYRIYALTPKMISDGLGYEDAQDAEQLFGKGSLWVDYPSYESAMDAVNSLNSDEYEHEEGEENF